MESEKALSLGDYLAALKRRRLLAVWAAVPVIVIGLVLALALPDSYSATATFRLVTERIAERANGGAEYADQYVFSLADKLFASQALEASLKGIDPYPGDNEDAVDLLGRVREDTTVEMVTRSVLEPGGGRGRIVNTGFSITYENRSPEKAGIVATELSRAIAEAGREEQLTAASSRVVFFSEEVSRAASQIATLEQQLAEFKSANFEQLPESAQASVMTRGRLEQELDGVERDIRTLRQNRVFVTQQLREAQAGPAAGNLRQLEEEYARKSAVYAETHPDLVALRRQIDILRRGGTVTTGNSLQAQVDQQKAILVEVQQRYSEDHPDVRRIMRNIEALEARIAAGESGAASGASDTLMSVQLQTQLNATNTQIEGLESRGASLRAKLGQLEAQLGATPEVEREYQQITRGLGSARDQYNQLIAKRLDADVDVAAINSGAADRFTLFTAPSTPWQPSGPPRLGILIASMLLALVLVLSSVVVAEMVDSSVRGSRDIRSLLDCSPLAAVPEIRNSVVRARRSRRIRVLAGSVLVGAPVLYLVVRLATA